MENSKCVRFSSIWETDFGKIRFEVFQNTTNQIFLENVLPKKSRSSSCKYLVRKCMIIDYEYNL